MKTCTKCYETKEASEFYETHGQCKDCLKGIKISVSVDEMEILEMEVLKIIDEMTWKSQYKIKWDNIKKTLKKRSYEQTLMKVNSNVIFENIIYNLKLKKLITSRNFPDVNPTQEGLRPTTKGHVQVVQREGAEE